jgi:hypothetical protein
MFGLQPPLHGRASANLAQRRPHDASPSIGILLRADRIAVAILIAAIAIIAAIVAVGSGRRGSDRRRPVSRSAIDASADSGACDRAAVSIAASRNAVSPTGYTVTTTTNRSAPEMGGTSVIASTPVAAATAPTCESIIRHEAGSD